MYGRRQGAVQELCPMVEEATAVFALATNFETRKATNSVSML